MQRSQNKLMDSCPIVLASVLIIYCVGVTFSVEIGDYPSIVRYNREILSPFTVNELHSDQEDYIVVASSQTVDAAGSGDYSLEYDDTEAGGDVDLVEPWQIIPADGMKSNNEAHVTSNSNVLQLEEDILTLENYSVNVESTGTPVSQTKQIILSTTQTQQPTPQTQQPTPQTQQPTPQTQQPTPQAPPTEAITADPLCHEECVDKLHNSLTLGATPDVTLLPAGDSVQFICQVAETLQGNMQTVELQWIFEGESSPIGECSVDGEAEYLGVCAGFPSVTSDRATNSTHLAYTLTLAHLLPHNTGYFICQAVVHCCGSVVLQQQRRYLRVWYADYTTELLLLGGLAVGLSLLLIAGLLYQRKRQTQLKQNYMQVLVVPATLKDAANQRTQVVPLPADDAASLSGDSFDYEYSD